MLSQNMCNKSRRRYCRSRQIEKEILIDNSIEEYMNEVKRAIKDTKKALIKIE